MPKKKLITIIKDCLEEMKAQDTVILDIKDKSSIADYMVVSSGTSTRHVSSIADKIQRTLKGLPRSQVCGVYEIPNPAR